MSTAGEGEASEGRAARSWLLREARALRGRALRPIVLGAAITCAAIAQALLIARLIATLLGFEGYGGWGDLALAAALALLMAGLGAAQEQAQVAAGEAARAKFREAAFARLLAADTVPVGEKASLLVDRIEALDGFFARWIPAVALALISPALVLLAALAADWVSAAVLLVMGLLVPVAMALTGIGAALESRRQLDALGRLSGRFVDRLRGLKTLVLFNRQEDEARAMGAAAEELRARTLRVLRVAFLSTASLEFLAAGTLAYLAWRHGAHLGADHPNPALAIFCILLVPVFFAPLRAFSQSYHEAMAARGAAAALLPVLSREAPGGLRLEEVPPRVAVALSDVRLTYDASRGEALSGLTFAAAPGETVLLVGQSGAGKSSALKLLMGFARPDSGRVAINGQDATALAPAELRRLSCYVGQRAHLFAGTIAENIALAREGASAEQVRRAAEQARVTAFSDALPRGLDTPVGEGGHGLSGGQAQRVALARAFLRDAPLVLLDEPTANLDPGTEAEVLDAIARLCVGRTAVIATHSRALRGLPGGRVVEVAGGRAVAARAAGD